MYVTHVTLAKLGYVKRNMLKNCIILAAFHYLLLMEVLY